MPEKHRWHPENGDCGRTGLEVSWMHPDGHVVRAALAPGSINNILVIELENEDASTTFGPGSPATYLNDTLVPEGELLQNYYAIAIGHVSLDNYIAEISGQAPTP
jgi:phosphatidylinositol-3-phosphatase